MKRRMIYQVRNAVIAVIVAVLSLIPFSGIALADQADPDEIPTVDTYIYRNVLETGDFFIYMYINIPYAATPTASIDESFIIRLIDTDNVTELGQVTGYPFDTSGYGYNIYSMYFDATDAPTWNQNYIIRLSGNPLIFDDPPIYDYVINLNSYSALTTQADVQAAIAARILDDCRQLDIEWGLTDSLITQTEIGDRLSLVGESFIRNAIYGAQAIAPEAFVFGVGSVTYTDRTWSENYTANLSNQYTGTWIATAQTAGATLFSKSYDLTSIIILVVLGLMIVVGNIMLSSNHWSALVDVCILLVVAAKLGLYEASFLGLVAALSWLYISAKTWGKIS